MSIPRPKILSVFTVPTGGWNFVVYVSKSSQYDTKLTMTIPAGDYFMSGDNQDDDDFLYQIEKLTQAAITACAFSQPTAGHWSGILQAAGPARYLQLDLKQG